jgi:hypothetical protein
LPLDGDFDVDSEHPSEDRSGDFGGEAEQRGGAVLLGPDPDFVEALADLVVAEGASRLTSGEKPGGVLRGADLSFAAAGRDEIADQAGQRRGEDDRRGAERDGDGVAVEVDVVDGELADGGDLLCIVDQQQSRDAVRGR